MMTITEAIEQHKRNIERLIAALDKPDELNKSGRVPAAMMAELVGKAEGMIWMSDEIDRGIAGALAEAKE